MGCGPSSVAESTLDDSNSTVLPGFNANHADHAKHHWTSISLPTRWEATFRTGTLSVTWKDQGWGNRKGHIWARVNGERPQPWQRLSREVAAHNWRSDTFQLPAAWFVTDEPENRSGSLELACDIGGGGGHSLHVRTGGQLSLTRRENAQGAVQAVVATPVAQEPQNGTTAIVVQGVLVAPSSGVGASAASAAPLADQVAVLQRELALRGTMIEVIDRACEQLGVTAQGKTLPERASLCIAALGVR